MGERVTFADLLKKAEAKKNTDVKTKLEVISSKIDDSEPTPPTPLTAPTSATPPTKATPSTPLVKNATISAAPERDFARVANSIVRDAVSQGLFIGKSKQIYDFLYLQTRGNIQPKRNIRMTKSNLMRGSGIGSERTLLKNLNHLKSLRLVKIVEFDGQHGGNDYEVFLPEEVGTDLPHPPHPHYPPQKVGWVPTAESGVGGVGLIKENKGLTEPLRLSLKTNTNDDDNALAIFAEKFSRASEKLTGEKLSFRDAEKWGTLADLLILELEIAARRTESISSVPAFLTEVLRRQFFAQRRQQLSAKSSKTKIDTVGKPDSESYEIKALDEKSRQAALEQLREFAVEDFLADFEKWYVPEDWTWLTNELAKN